MMRQIGLAEGAFLKAIHVRGFRGIGSTTSLTLSPTPGLTVVAGRNGSGKSSLAEGLELALTGDTYRWQRKQSTQWTDNWRNLHQGTGAEIRVDLVEQGSGAVWLRTAWADGATKADEHVTTAQRSVDGTKGPTQPASSLGWQGAVETFRPLLSYDELGGLLESGRTLLYDALAKVLGTEQLADAMRLLKDRLTVRSAPLKEATASRKALADRARTLEDERGKELAVLLGKPSPDSAAVRSLATGVTTPNQGLIADLRGLLRVEPPDPERIEKVTARVRAAVQGMADAGEDAASRRFERLDLRRRALALHDRHGDQSCPVCNGNPLDATWAETSRGLVADEERALKDLTVAQDELAAARQSLRALAVARPAATDAAPLEELEDAARAVREAWDAYVALPDGDLAAADHLVRHAEELRQAVTVLREKASAEIDARDDAWGPLAADAAAWCTAWDTAAADKAATDQLAAAEKWLKLNDVRLKNELLEPIADQARHAWSLLRQESNVDIGELRLTGQGNQRRVAISGTIDGTDAGNALPVMSQGELHALTLALFLPRATLDESPFRFVVLDDPIQAMDPAKVDGFVALLSEIAKDRQVIVFSHDDRLPAALRRTDASARILEVTRGTDSTVTVSTGSDPASRYLRDADALCRDDKVPAETLRRTLPGLLRMAVESAARDRYMSTRISRGEPVVTTEQEWNDAHGTSQRVSLAIYDEIRSLNGWLHTPDRKLGLGITTSGFHNSLHETTDPLAAVGAVRRMVDDIRNGAK